MSSTNKTKNLKLNSWIGSDKPQRLDFNYDNEIIDKAYSQHTEDTVSHITAEERDKWNTNVYMGTYYGTGSQSKSITHSCPFPIGFGMVFADSKTIQSYDSSSNKNISYFGFVTPAASTLGLSVNDTTLTVRQSASAVTGNNYAGFNEQGVVYRYVFIRASED